MNQRAKSTWEALIRGPHSGAELDGRIKDRDKTHHRRPPDAQAGPRRQSPHREGKVGQSLALAEVELCLDLRFQAAAAPAVCDGLADVKVPCGGVFDHLHEPDDVAPGQL